MKNDVLDEWKTRTCVIATMHGKERVIAPCLEEGLGIRTLVPNDFDTDRFGTFTREVKRAGNQLEAARAKARAALERTGVDLAVASEGSFGPDPRVPFLVSSFEIVVLIDAKHDLEIVGHHRTSDVLVAGKEVRTAEEAVDVARSWGFPERGVVVRASEKSSHHIYKDLTTFEDIQRVSEELLSRWFARSIYLETDMRAHRCPERMEAIKDAAMDLVKNCMSVCPRCAMPGFVITDTVMGLPCSGCGRPTDLVSETVRSCAQCQYATREPREDKTSADPSECPWCNP